MRQVLVRSVATISAAALGVLVPHSSALAQSASTALTVTVQEQALTLSQAVLKAIGGPRSTATAADVEGVIALSVSQSNAGYDVVAQALNDLYTAAVGNNLKLAIDNARKALLRKGRVRRGTAAEGVFDTGPGFSAPDLGGGGGSNYTGS